MSKSRAQSEQIFRHVGKLVIRWNDLETQMRRMVQSITEEWFTVHVLTADMNSAGLIRVLKLLAAEQDADMTRLNRFAAAAAEKTGRHLRKIDMISEHVGRLADSADSLRLHRNLYAHCISSPTKEVNSFTLGGWTTRSGRFAGHDQPLRLREIARTISLIDRTIRYAKRLEKCLQLNAQPRHRPGPKWPPKIPIPAKPNKQLISISERMPLL
jgi:hypothetical protein